MFLYIYTYTSTYIYTHTYTHTHIYTHIYTHTYRVCIYVCAHTHTHIYIHTYIHIHRHIQTYKSLIYIHTQTHMHIYTYTYITTSANNPSPTPNMQLPAGYLQLKLIFKNYHYAKSNSNIQRNDIMEKSFAHFTIDVMSLVILICNEKLLTSRPTKTNMNKRGFS